MSKLPEFSCEQFLTAYEKQVPCNITDTCVLPFHLDQLLDFCSADLGDIVLGYGDITGSSRLKQAILALYQSGSERNITTAAGCVNASQLVMDVLLDGKTPEKVMVFTPGYQQYESYPAVQYGAEILQIPYTEKEGRWSVDLEMVRKAAENGLDLVIFSNPGNPLGASLNEEELLALIETAREHDAWILCDEVYRGLGKDIPSISDLYEKGITTSSLSKTYSLPGLRLGWIKAPEEIINAVNLNRDYTLISAPVLSDCLAATALEHHESIRARNDQIIEANKRFLRQWLQRNSAFSSLIPESGSVCLVTYDFPIDSEEFSARLRKEKGVLVIPGSCFGTEDSFRLGLGIDGQVFQNGLRKIEEWTKSLL